MANFIVILNGKLHFAAGILFESCHSMANFIVIWMESKPNVRQGKVIVLKFGFKRFGQQVPFERPPKPPTFWNSYTRTLILDTIMKLSGTIGVTQKTMTLDTHVRLILLQTLNPQERWGTHKKRWPFQPRLFADVIGLVRCSFSPPGCFSLNGSGSKRGFRPHEASDRTITQPFRSCDSGLGGFCRSTRSVMDTFSIWRHSTPYNSTVSAVLPILLQSPVLPIGWDLFFRRLGLFGITARDFGAHGDGDYVHAERDAADLWAHGHMAEVPQLANSGRGGAAGAGCAPCPWWYTGNHPGSSVWWTPWQLGRDPKQDQRMATRPSDMHSRCYDPRRDHGVFIIIFQPYSASNRRAFP